MTPRMRFLTVPLLAVVLAACQFGPQDTRPVPSVRQIGSDLKCPSKDHGYDDQVGWGFCYPGTWQYTVKSQSNTTPILELDVIFDVTNVPTYNGKPLRACGSPAPPPTTPPVCDPDAGLFGVMIVSTYARNNAPDLATWVKANMPSAPEMQTIAWGNSVEAARFADGRRIAMTQQQVVILSLHPGNLDLEGAMSTRLGTWKFTV